MKKFKSVFVFAMLIAGAGLFAGCYDDNTGTQETFPMEQNNNTGMTGTQENTPDNLEDNVIREGETTDN